MPKLQARVKCQHCGMIRIIPMEKYKIGEILMPYPGGGNHGRCIRCKRVGLQVIEVPREAPQKPVGWRKIPEE